MLVINIKTKIYIKKCERVMVFLSQYYRDKIITIAYVSLGKYEKVYG